MGEKHYYIDDIIQEITERLEIAEKDAKEAKNDDFKWGYYQAYWEVSEIINNREY